MTEPATFHEDATTILPAATDVDRRSSEQDAAVVSARVAFQRASLLMFDAIVMAIRAVTTEPNPVSDNRRTQDQPAISESTKKYVDARLRRAGLK